MNPCRRAATPVLLLLACALVAAPVAAQKKRKDEPPEPTPPTLFATPVSLMIAGFDSDGDAVVTRAEYDAGVARSFAAGDSDGDGRISLIELSRWAQHWLGSPGAVPGQYDFDKDGDDSISRDEYVAEFAARFAALDKDADGALPRAELISFVFPRLERGRGRPPPPQ